jgi:phosphonate dehydrogenase
MSRPRVVVGSRVFSQTLEALRPHAQVVFPARGERLSPRRLASALKTADAWMAFMPDVADEALLDRCPRLKVIAGALKGADNIDLAACERREVWVSIVPDLLTAPTAELAVGLMIGLGRRILQADAFARSARFTGWSPRFYGVGLERARVGLVGYGAIGQAIAKALGAFGSELAYFDPHVGEKGGETKGDPPAVRAGDLEELLSWSDYLVLALPLTQATLRLIDERALALMKPGALLINPSRGSLVDEAAVLAALQSGRLGGYAADVFAFEDLALADRPRSLDPALRRHPSTLFTPHIGSAVAEARQAIEARAAANILDVLEGRPPRDLITSKASGAGEDRRPADPQASGSDAGDRSAPP